VRAAESGVERAAVPLAGARAAEAAARDELARAVAGAEQRLADEGEAWSTFDRDRGSFTLLELQSALVSLEGRDRKAEAIEHALEKLEAERGDAEGRVAQARTDLEAERSTIERAREREQGAAARVVALSDQIRAEVGERTAADLAGEVRARLDAVVQRAEHAERAAAEAAARREHASTEATRADEATRAAAEELEASHRALAELARRAGVELPDDAQIERWSAEMPDDATLARWQREASEWQERRVSLEARLTALSDCPVAPDDLVFARLAARLEEASTAAERARDEAATTSRHHEELVARSARFAELSVQAGTLDLELARLGELGQLLRGDRFVEFVANDHLTELTARAAAYLGELTGGRYGLALDDELAFVVRDEEAGGAVRPVHTLSGGESFLTALSLALALSTKIQERSARPLGFFFLDEGFGTLDPEAIDRVLSAIEHLRDERRLIGLISHVPAIRERVPRYLWVSGDATSGSKVEVHDN
jgi:exonuclease SbcC